MIRSILRCLLASVSGYALGRFLRGEHFYNDGEIHA